MFRSLRLNLQLDFIDASAGAHFPYPEFDPVAAVFCVTDMRSHAETPRVDAAFGTETTPTTLDGRRALLRTATASLVLDIDRAHCSAFDKIGIWISASTVGRDGHTRAHQMLGGAYVPLADLAVGLADWRERIVDRCDGELYKGSLIVQLRDGSNLRAWIKAVGGMRAVSAAAGSWSLSRHCATTESDVRSLVYNEYFKVVDEVRPGTPTVRNKHVAICATPAGCLPAAAFILWRPRAPPNTMYFLHAMQLGGDPDCMDVDAIAAACSAQLAESGPAVSPGFLLAMRCIVRGACMYATALPYLWDHSNRTPHSAAGRRSTDLRDVERMEIIAEMKGGDCEDGAHDPYVHLVVLRWFQTDQHADVRLAAIGAALRRYWLAMCIGGAHAAAAGEGGGGGEAAPRPDGPAGATICHVWAAVIPRVWARKAVYRGTNKPGVDASSDTPAARWETSLITAGGPLIVEGTVLSCPEMKPSYMYAHTSEAHAAEAEESANRRVRLESAYAVLRHLSVEVHQPAHTRAAAARHPAYTSFYHWITHLFTSEEWEAGGDTLDYVFRTRAGYGACFDDFIAGSSDISLVPTFRMTRGEPRTARMHQTLRLLRPVRQMQPPATLPHESIQPEQLERCMRVLNGLAATYPSTPADSARRRTHAISYIATYEQVTPPLCDALRMILTARAGGFESFAYTVINSTRGGPERIQLRLYRRDWVSKPGRRLV